MIKESKSHEKIALPPSTLLNPVPVVMISCAGKNPELPLERPNIMTVAWAGTVCSEPPMVFISVRSNRHSYPLIRETGEFVINLVTEDLFKACDYCGVRSGAKEDKFAAMSLTSVPAEGLQYAPAILEAPLSMACQVVSETELGSHIMFVAKIVSVSADMNLFDKEGKLCLDDAKLIAYSHGEYYSLGQILGFFGHSVASPEAYERRMKGKNQPEKVVAEEITTDTSENEDAETTEKEENMKSENQKPDNTKSEFKKSNYSKSRERKPGFSKSDEGSSFAPKKPSYAPKKPSYAPKKPSFPRSDSRDSRPPRDGDSRDSRPPRDFGDRDSRPSRDSGDSRSSRPSSYSSSGPRTTGYSSSGPRTSSYSSSGPRKPSFPRSDSRDSRPPRDSDSRDSRPPRDSDSRDARPPRDSDSRDARPPRDFGDRDSRPSRDSGDSRSSRPSSYSSSGPRTSSYSSSGPRKPSFPRSDSRDTRPTRDGDSRDSRPPRDFGDRDSRPSRDSGDSRSSRPSSYSSSGPRKPGFTKPGFRKPGPGGSSDNGGRNRFGPSSH